MTNKTDVVKVRLYSMLICLFTTDSTDSPDCLPILLSISCSRLSRLMSAFERTLKQHLVYPFLLISFSLYVHCIVVGCVRQTKLSACYNSMSCRIASCELPNGNAIRRITLHKHSPVRRGFWAPSIHISTRIGLPAVTDRQTADHATRATLGRRTL